MDSVRLCFRSARYIEGFLSQHPMEWGDQRLAERGGPGDQAGMTPTPAVQEFLELAHQTPKLFTFKEYISHCLTRWGAWYTALPTDQQRGVVAKLRNNFYPAMIDTLHAQALLMEACVLDIVLLDSRSDVEDKVDLVVMKHGLPVRVALIGPGERASENRAYKLRHRPGLYDAATIQIVLPRERRMNPGNKRWFRLEDFRTLLTGDWISLVAQIRNARSR